jgi:hypothetical protein
VVFDGVRWRDPFAATSVIFCFRLFGFDLNRVIFFLQKKSGITNVSGLAMLAEMKMVAKYGEIE